jgi:hypothetical protein
LAKGSRTVVGDELWKDRREHERMLSALPGDPKGGSLAMDQELQRLFQAVQSAETEWREHRQSALQAWYQDGGSIGSGSAHPFTREWREQEESLRQVFEAARCAWMSHLPE